MPVGSSLLAFVANVASNLRTPSLFILCQNVLFDSSSTQCTMMKITYLFIAFSAVTSAFQPVVPQTPETRSSSTLDVAVPSEEYNSRDFDLNFSMKEAVSTFAVFRELEAAGLLVDDND